MKFTNKLGVYTLQGRALNNYKAMQCKPAYRRYKANLKRHCQSEGFPTVEPIPFSIFKDLYILRNKEQERLI